MKSLLIALAVMTATISAHAGWGHRPPPPPHHHRPYPPPYYPPAYPPYPAPYYVTCFAQGTYNGVVFYGTGPNVYVASNNAMFACQSTGQYCLQTGCR